jgi:hypothetical protein
MDTDKTEGPMEKTAATKAPAVAKKAVKPATKKTVKPVVRRVTKKPVSATSATVKVKKVACDFSLPQVEYLKVAEIKDACLKAGVKAKKSEILRAGLKVLGEMNGKQIMRVIAGLKKTKVALRS